MQTFLPFPSFEQSAKCLDYKRLGKQRVEARTIINTLEGRSSGWIHHPVMSIWRGYEDALKQYFNIMSTEWINRGYKHTMGFYDVVGDYELPPIVGREDFHLSHQSNLLRKLESHYSSYFSRSVPHDLPYVWR